jgi:hypothetical protein
MINQSNQTKQIMQIIQGGRAVEVDRLLDLQRAGDHCCQVEIRLGVRLGLVDRLRVDHELA